MAEGSARAPVASASTGVEPVMIEFGDCDIQVCTRNGREGRSFDGALRCMALPPGVSRPRTEPPLLVA